MHRAVNSQYRLTECFCVTTVNPQTKEEAVELATGIADAVTDKSPGDVGLFVPFPFLETVQKIAGDKFAVGAEVGGCVDEVYLIKTSCM